MYQYIFNTYTYIHILTINTKADLELKKCKLNILEKQLFNAKVIN